MLIRRQPCVDPIEADELFFVVMLCCGCVGMCSVPSGNATFWNVARCQPLSSLDELLLDGPGAVS